jgi:hypothetical protein
MSITRIVLTVLAAAIVVGPARVYASDTVINFSSLSQPGSTYVEVGNSVTQQGFTLGGGDLYVWQASSPNLPGLSTADTSLFEFFAGDPISITAAGDAPFTLNSIDLAPLIAGGDSVFKVTFTGTFADSSTLSQTFTVSDSDTLQTFDLSGFTNVVDVSFMQGANNGFFGSQGTAYQFDNVDVSLTPEPGTAVLWLTGIGLMIIMRKRIAQLLRFDTGTHGSLSRRV